MARGGCGEVKDSGNASPQLPVIRRAEPRNDGRTRFAGAPHSFLRSCRPVLHQCRRRLGQPRFAAVDLQPGVRYGITWGATTASAQQAPWALIRTFARPGPSHGRTQMTQHDTPAAVADAEALPQDL